jgi:cytidylate kinase
MERAPRSVDAMVGAQVSRWLGERERINTPTAGPPPPVVTLSREFGAQGAAVGKLVAERLQYSFWNRELLAAIAEHAHVDAAALARFDEHHPSAIAETMSGLMPGPARIGQVDYARELTTVVRDIVSRGGAVLVGRGLNFMIDRSRALRVRVVCPLEQRIAVLAERDHISTTEARARIADADRDRRAFVRDLYGKDIDDPAGYDVWVNTGTLTLDAAADIVTAAVRSQFAHAQGSVNVVR